MIRVPLPLVKELRSILRDYPEVNYIFEDEESIDSQLARALWEGLEDLMNVPPIFNEVLTFETLPRIWVRTVLDLAVCRVLQEVSIYFARNEFDYQTGNTSVRLYNQWQHYQQILPGLKAQAESAAQALKYKANCDKAWGASLTELYETWRALDPNTQWVTVSS